MAKQMKLNEEETRKLAQLTYEMRDFPPENFTSENLLAWAKFFHIAPKQLGSHTDELSIILNNTYAILVSEGATT